MEAFPTGLPAVTSAVQVDLQRNAETVMFETGRVRQRQMHEHTVAFYDVEWYFKEFAFAVFEAFHRTKISYGTDWFTINIPTHNGIQSVTARFVRGQYKSKYSQVKDYNVNATLEVRE